MTGEELRTIEERWFAVHTTYTTLPDGTETVHYGAQHRHAGHDIFALLDEVRRLRGLLKALVEEPPIQYRDGDYPHCGYCGAYLDWLSTHDLNANDPHAADCPWRLAYEALHTSPSRVR